MTQVSYPFQNQPVTEVEFSSFFRHLQDTGVTDTSGLTVSADSSGLLVRVSTGLAVVRGFFYSSSEVETLTITGGGVAARIDAIVLRLDPATDNITLAVKQGTEAATPAAPAMTQTDTGVYEMRLANVTVPAGAVTIAASNVADARNLASTFVRRWTATARRPTGVLGAFGYDAVNDRFQYHDGTAWKNLFPFDPAKSTLDGRTFYDGDNPPANSLGANGDVYYEY